MAAKVKECFICFEAKTCMNFTLCTCKMDLCFECFCKWNDKTYPILLCPVCRTHYGDIRLLKMPHLSFHVTLVRLYNRESDENVDEYLQLQHPLNKCRIFLIGFIVLFFIWLGLNLKAATLM
jgi:hypothetical protein